MSEHKLEGLRVAILATDLSRKLNWWKPAKRCRRLARGLFVIAPKSGEIQAVQHDKKTQKVKVDMTLDQAKPEEFDAVLLPGGAMNADALRMEKKAQEFVKAFDREGKPIAVICHGPWLLISAGLVKGRHMTSYYTIQDDLKNAGAVWNDMVSLRDRNWVSSRKPDDIPQFNKNMIELFSESRQKSRKVA